MSVLEQELVEKVARAMSAGRGFDPDEMVPRSGYPQDRDKLIPKWHFDVEWAMRHIAADKALQNRASDGPAPERPYHTARNIVCEEWQRAVKEFGLTPGSITETVVSRIINRLDGEPGGPPEN